ncbi:hypothetical protein BDM02DRAFT_3184347 [Thelephora ganbajun]|uniref:Uncharacterized protein n=1 Tax=Thelephora ganbajun TaxID=370292 RepID=A0ACB6ZPT3_THEGA|nr:hypothetical protein BDM02DRAFT_3184347 [Thelephora ganbajun]
MTELILKQGGIAIVALRSPSALDALRRGDINAAFEHAKAKVGRIDFAFNNAVCCLMAEVGRTPKDVARAMFEVNFRGAAYAAREAVKSFRGVNQPQGGVLLNVSSYMGLVPQPLMGYYVAPKHEIKPICTPWVSLLKFGGSRTAATKSMVIVPARTSHTNPALPSIFVRKPAGEWQAQGDPDKAIKFIYDFVNSVNQLPIRLAVGLDVIGMIKRKLKVLHNDLENAEKVHKDVVFTRTG